MNPGQFFIVGMNGSGTTMLLDCLAGHSQIYGFRGETKVLPYFLKRQQRYGDLTDDGNFARLWHDLDSAVGGKGWPRRSSASAIASWGQRPRSAAAIFDWSLATLASQEGKRIWCEKTPMYVNHLKLLSDAFPDARFVHVIRDGRDCAASFHRRWKFNPLRTIYRWKRAVRAGRLQGAQLGNRYFETRYEKLSTSPKASLEELCHFLEIPFEPSILAPARYRPEMTGSSATFIATNERRAERYFDRTTIERLETIAGRQLSECQYATSYAMGDEDPSSLQLRWWEMQDDSRRFVGALRRVSRLQASSRLSFVWRRVQGAYKQRVSNK